MLLVFSPINSSLWAYFIVFLTVPLFWGYTYLRYCLSALDRVFALHQVLTYLPTYLDVHQAGGRSKFYR